MNGSSGLDFWLFRLVPATMEEVPRVAGTVGSLVYAAIEVLDKLFAAFGVRLGGRTKLAMSLIGAIGVPAGALVWVTARNKLPRDTNLWALVGAAGAWMVSQVAHGALEKKECP